MEVRVAARTAWGVVRRRVITASRNVNTDTLCLAMWPIVGNDNTLLVNLYVEIVHRAMNRAHLGTETVLTVEWDRCKQVLAITC